MIALGTVAWGAVIYSAASFVLVVGAGGLVAFGRRRYDRRQARRRPSGQVLDFTGRLNGRRDRDAA